MGPGERSTNITPKGFLDIAGERLPPRYARQPRVFRYGPAEAKVDFLVSEPIPWADPEVGRAGSVRLGGTQAEMWRREPGVARGRGSTEPFVLLVDPAVTDSERARPGRRPVWAYAHVPNGDGTDPEDLVQARIERYAPGFGDSVIERRGISGLAFEAYNPNYVGGDISAGATTLKQRILRPVPRLAPPRPVQPGRLARRFSPIRAAGPTPG